MPQDDLFADEASPATAAIMLGNPADTLGPGAVRGMAQLTASSVKGLKTENVTITDSSGAMLWPSTDGSGGAGGGSSKASAEARKARADRELDQRDARLHARPGQGPGQGQRRPQRGRDAREKELTYAAKGTPLKTTEETEKLTGSGATTGGTAGTGSNVPTYSGANGAGGGKSNYSEQEGHDRLSASTRRSPTPRSPPARSTSSTSRCWSTSRSRRTSSTRSRRRSPPPPASTPARGDTITADPDGVRQGRGAQGGPGADDAARPAQVGRPRPREPALPVLHDARPAQARGREPRHAGLADHDRGADVAGAARGPHVGQLPRQRLDARCFPRASRTPACISSTS